MERCARPATRECLFFPSHRAATFERQSRQHHGTLNLFAPESLKPVETSVPSSRSRSVRDPNRQSTATREFPSSGIRQVVPLSHEDVPHGIRQVVNARGIRQQIQVVNISAAYRDPTQMDTRRAVIRCDPARRESQELRHVLSYSDAAADHLRPELQRVPVGQSRPAAALRHIDYSRQENFCQAVRNHVLQRSRGVANFYVLLCRDMIGEVTPETPRPAWRLTQSNEEEPQPAKVLVLQRCRDQLVSLTAIPVTLLEVADIMWDMGDYKGKTKPWDEAAELSEMPVPFKDFATAFGANSSNVRLAVKKL